MIFILFNESARYESLGFKNKASNATTFDLNFLCVLEDNTTCFKWGEYKIKCCNQHEHFSLAIVKFPWHYCMGIPLV